MVNLVNSLNQFEPIVFPAIIQDGFWIKNLNEETKVIIFNSIGQPLFTSFINDWKNPLYFVLSNFSKGIYFIALQSRQRSKTFKILKQ